MEGKLALRLSITLWGISSAYFSCSISPWNNYLHFDTFFCKLNCSSIPWISLARPSLQLQSALLRPSALSWQRPVPKGTTLIYKKSCCSVLPPRGRTLAEDEIIWNRKICSLRVPSEGSKGQSADLWARWVVRPLKNVGAYLGTQGVRVMNPP